MKCAVHITHETIKKIGGIGAVLNGLCSSGNYSGFFGKTVLYGPLFGESRGLFKDIGKEGSILFSSADSHDTGKYGEKLKEVIEKYNVNIVCARKEIKGEFNSRKRNTIDIVILDSGRMREKEISSFKYLMWEKFGIQSDLYENDRDYEQYLRLAVPFLAIMDALYGGGYEYYHFAHEYMGILSALSVKASGRGDKTVFTAHEVSTVRTIIESLGGHDISFYNIMRKAEKGQSLEEVFGSQRHNPRNELVKRAVHLDRIFAVSDLVKEEYGFLVPQVDPNKTRVVYNGLSTKRITYGKHARSRELIRNYTGKLLNYSPDIIMTHVTRLVHSKGVWRDIALLYMLDAILHRLGLKGVFLLLSSFAGERPAEDVCRMEHDYGWPLAHKEGWPDLVGIETEVHHYLQLFNARAKAIRGVFINQFGFSRSSCGMRVPEGAEFADLRLASDAEFGFSVYEPFGIAQIETIPFGGLAVFSSSCGASFLLRSVFRDAEINPFEIVDFIEYGRKHIEYEKLRHLNPRDRDRVERIAISESAEKIFSKLSFSEDIRRKMLAKTAPFLAKLDWDSIVSEYFLPNLP